MTEEQKINHLRRIRERYDKRRRRNRESTRKESGQTRLHEFVIGPFEINEDRSHI